MIRNNIVAFIFHILLIVLSTFYLILVVSLSPYIRDIIVNPLIRGIFAVIWAAIYIYIGTKMNLKHRRKVDYFCGILITLVGLILWGNSLINSELIPLNVYLNPIYQICLLLDIRFDQLMILISCFIPSILIGIGVKFKRIRYSRRRMKAVSKNDRS